MTKLNRRKFLKLAGVTGALAVPMLSGYGLLRAAEGEALPEGSPYAAVVGLESGPILVLTNQQSDNPFGIYLTEILRAEGLNCFHIADLFSVNSDDLNQFDLVILAEGTLNSSQVELLEGYVARGGRLVAMRPDTRLAGLFGLKHIEGNTKEGYLQIDTEHPIGQGIATETLQIHGIADHYLLAGAQVIAWLASDADTRTDFPAITINHYGQGQTALWAFDLAYSVAYTRQGNPAWADQDRDGFDHIRACDMFDDWVDLDRLIIPQADHQQRLLANVLAALSQNARPLPRLWYFPGAAEAMLIATGDAHQSPHWAIEDVLTRVERRSGRMSIYYSSPLHFEDWWRAARRVRFWATDLPLVGEMLANRYSSPTPSQVIKWRARGHEFALHPHVGTGTCGWFTDDGILPAMSLEESWRRYWQEFTSQNYGPVPPTVRTHCILWTGWVETARLQASYGMRMNLDYYHVGPAFRKERGEWVQGHFNGSGLPMRFIDEQGRLLNIYQQLTQIVDEHLLELHWGGQVKMSPEAATEVSKMLLRRSLAGDYAAVTANFHVDPFALEEKWYTRAARWLDGTLDCAVEYNVPIWSALDWLHFTEARHDSNLEEIQWHLDNPGQDNQKGHLSFRLVTQPTSNPELVVMIPIEHGKARLVGVEVDGQTTEYKERKVGSVGYGWVTVGTGSRQVVAIYS